jgi:hypothetical protein
MNKTLSGYVIFFYVRVTVHRNVTVHHYMWPSIVTNFFTIKPTRCTNFTNLFCHETTCFGQFVCPSSGVYSLYTQQGQDGTVVPSWSCSKAVYKPVWRIPLLSLQWINSWWWTDELSETCRVSWQNKFLKLVHLVGFITKKIGYVMFLYPSFFPLIILTVRYSVSSLFCLSFHDIT